MKFRINSLQRDEGRRGHDEGQEPTSRKIEYQKDAMRSRDEKLEENFETIQKGIEYGAAKVAHSTKKQREKL